MEIFMVTGCLQKDINGKNDAFRANAIRTLAKIIDASMAAQIDRFLKTALVDKNAFVASSALMCGISLMKTCPEVVKRWVTEIQESINSPHPMVQYHALALMYEIKKNDRLALHKVVTQLARSGLQNPMAECILVRIATTALVTETDPSIEKPLIGFLDHSLRNKNEMVTYEAARSFVRLALLEENSQGSTVRGYDFMHAITILQIFLTSPKPVVRFAAIRTLNELAMKRPQVVARCNCDMEPLLTDPNRPTATLALTTLLKTGHESNVDRLVKQISSFMTDLTDVFKMEVVRAVKGLCLQYPAKYKVLMSFLSTNLREEASNDFKTELVDAITLIMETLPQTREIGLLHMCEFIEDCEYPALCQRILAFLADMVPTTSQPSKYVRFIYNRLILENAVVRGAAVDALAKIAMRCKPLRRDILVLLESAQNDNDDEVRDRIFLYRQAIGSSIDDAIETDSGFDDLMSSELPFSVDALFYSLGAHVQDTSRNTTLFQVKNLPTDEQYKIQQDSLVQSTPKVGAGGAAAAGRPTESDMGARPAGALMAEELLSTLSAAVPQDVLGNLQFSCNPQALTETEAEFPVKVIKHMFERHIVLEFTVSNTIEGCTLENVQLRLGGVVANVLRQVGALAISQLAYEQNASAYLIYEKVQQNLVASGSFTANLVFLNKEDDDDLGYDDDAQLDGFAIATKDYIFPQLLPQGQFKAAWEKIGASGHEAQAKLSLNFKSLEAAVEGVVAVLNMQACDDSATVVAEKRSHNLMLNGIFVGGIGILVWCLICMDPTHGCVMKLTARSNNSEVCESVAAALK
eukprot:GEMP01002297.1.p1 GENE.GEMP01002297.1~~GEMP01002297.1.p1  ORF type:complete len:807 (+),score=146.51 GEMP01002297.1:405-2825(+)